ncbi:MAG: esterase/lipase family protein [Micromonosporaceae bacterium]
MTPAEFRALGRLGGQAAAGVASRAERVHEAVADRVFRQIKEVSAPVRFIHDTVARGVYLGVKSACEAAGVAGGEIMSKLGADGDPPPAGHRWFNSQVSYSRVNLGVGVGVGRAPLGDTALAALNAVAGDRLGNDVAPLAIRMAVRKAGRDVGLASEELAEAFPEATSRLAVFVHGLAETEDAWLGFGWGARGEDSAPYGENLRAHFGYTPVYVRYNTGRHISDNGRDLAGLLADVTAAWPAPVEELLLVGHSMGGLVIRAACHYGERQSAAWAGIVRHIFYLGSPHLGAPLARAAGLAGWALARTAETRPFVTLVNGSSAGIKDLRYGYVVDGDWTGCDLDSCARDHRGDTPLLPGANHHAIGATVTGDPGSPFGAVVGDLLVTPGSAHGRRRRHQRIPFRVALSHVFGGMHHLDLLNHPAVWEAMHGRLAGAVSGGGSSV